MLTMQPGSIERANAILAGFLLVSTSLVACTSSTQPTASTSSTLGTDIQNSRYLLAFHTCDTTTGTTYCAGNPTHHYTRLASSSDGASWNLVSSWSAYQGSVPDLVVRGSTAYFYNASTQMRKVSLTTGEVATAELSIQKSDGSEVRFVDPSPIVDGSGRIVLFFLNSTANAMGTDPASCSAFSCTKYFDSATEVAGSDGTQFLLDDGDRATITLTGVAPSLTASDPDVFADASGYVMLISQGPSTLAFRSTTLTGSFVSISGLTNDTLAELAGGVPAGHYDSKSGEYWIYVTQGGTTAPAVIARAKTTTLKPLSVSDFTAVVPGSVIDLGSSTTFESPGFFANP